MAATRNSTEGNRNSNLVSQHPEDKIDRLVKVPFIRLRPCGLPVLLNYILVPQSALLWEYPQEHPAYPMARNDSLEIPSCY